MAAGRSDLYHFGHFALKFRTHRNALLDHGGYELRGERQQRRNDGGEERVDVDALVAPRGGGAPRAWRFTQVRAAGGRNAGCWLTEALTPLDE